MINITDKKEKFIPMVKMQPQGMKIAFGYKDYYVEDEDGNKIPTELGTWTEHTFTSDRTLYQLKEFILGELNRRIDEKILTGFKWQGFDVWLSSENQFNYKVAYDYAIKTDGKNLPLVFKFGSTDNPTYYTFTSVQELESFFDAAMDYVSKVLEEGWKEKDSIDWSLYNIE